MGGSKATIVDIARELGISKSAVANVLSGTGRFSAETSAMVHATAERLGYVSNRAARTLRTGRIGAYGLRFVPPERRAEVEKVGAHVHQVLGRYLRGQRHIRIGLAAPFPSKCGHIGPAVGARGKRGSLVKRETPFVLEE